MRLILAVFLVGCAYAQQNYLRPETEVTRSVHNTTGATYVLAGPAARPQ